MLAFPFDAQTARMDLVRSNLPTDTNTKTRHAMYEIVHHTEVRFAPVQPLGVALHTQHPAMHAYGFRRHAQEVRRRGIVVKRRTGKANLIQKQLLVCTLFFRHRNVSHQSPPASSAANA